MTRMSSAGVSKVFQSNQPDCVSSHPFGSLSGTGFCLPSLNCVGSSDATLFSILSSLSGFWLRLWLTVYELPIWRIRSCTRFKHFLDNYVHWRLMGKGRLRQWKAWSRPAGTLISETCPEDYSLGAPLCCIMSLGHKKLQLVTTT